MREKQLVDLLISKGYTIASAESCTGGMFASTIVNVPNASRVINASIVTYSIDAKTHFVGVPAEVIEKYGVVSEEVARDMAKGVAEACKANVGVSFTGVAGPGGGSKSTPVGTVCIGFCVDGVVTSTTKVFKGGRMRVRKQCVKYAIGQLIHLLK